MAGIAPTTPETPVEERLNEGEEVLIATFAQYAAYPKLGCKIKEIDKYHNKWNMGKSHLDQDGFYSSNAQECSSHRCCLFLTNERIIVMRLPTTTRSEILPFVPVPFTKHTEDALIIFNNPYDLIIQYRIVDFAKSGGEISKVGLETPNNFCFISSIDERHLGTFRNVDLKEAINANYQNLGLIEGRGLVLTKYYSASFAQYIYNFIYNHIVNNNIQTRTELIFHTCNNCGEFSKYVAELDKCFCKKCNRFVPEMR